MKCLHCDSENFTVKSILFPIDFKGETVEVFSEAFICDDCGEPFMDCKQMDSIRRISADKYREMHGLLQSHEIVAIRERLEMSREMLARFLGILPDELKRYETYYVQPKEIEFALRHSPIANPFSKDTKPSTSRKSSTKLTKCAFI